MVAYTKPLDGGWAWVIAFCGVYHHMCTTGLIFSMGVLYVSWLDQFGGGKGATSWILSTCVATTFGLCPIPANLAARFGFRVVGFIGGLLSCTGLILSVFATSVTYLVVSIGIVSGLGCCFCYLPGVTVVATYFEKHRSMAMGIATSGVGLGTFVFAPLINYLEETYGWRGALLLCGGMSLNMCVTSLLLRPIHISVSEEDSEESSEERKVLLQNNKASLHEQVMPIVRVELADDDGGMSKNSSSALSVYEGPRGPAINNSRTNFVISSKEVHHNGVAKGLSIPVVAALRQSSNHGAPSDSVDSLGGVLLRVQHESVGKRMCASLSELVSKKTSSNHHRSAHNLNPQRASNRSRYHESVFKSLQNIDLNMIASIRGFHHILSKSDLNEEMSSLISIETNYRSRSIHGDDYYSEPQKKTFLTKLLTNPTVKTNLEILRDKAFLALAFSNFLTNLAFMSPLVYMVDRAIHQGIDKPTAAILISANGIGNIFGRIFFGWLFDRCCSNRLLAYSLCVSVSGIVTMLSSLCGDMVSLHAFYAAIFGCLMGVYTILSPLVTVDLMGVSRVAKSFGLVLSFSGLATVIGPPVAGWLFDWSKSYDLSFVTSGIFLLASGLMLIPLLCLTTRRQNEQSEEDKR